MSISCRATDDLLLVCVRPAGHSGDHMSYYGCTWPQSGVDGGASGLAREVNEPANTKEQVLRISLERLIQQWEQRISHFAFELEQTPESSAFSNGANAVMKDLKAVLSSLTREREP